MNRRTIGVLIVCLLLLGCGISFYLSGKAKKAETAQVQTETPAAGTSDSSEAVRETVPQDTETEEMPIRLVPRRHKNRLVNRPRHGSRLLILQRQRIPLIRRSWSLILQRQRSLLIRRSRLPSLRGQRSPLIRGSRLSRLPILQRQRSPLIRRSRLSRLPILQRQRSPLIRRSRLSRLLILQRQRILPIRRSRRLRNRLCLRRSRGDIPIRTKKMRRA